MRISHLVLSFILGSSLLRGQITNDSLQRLLMRTELQIEFYTLHPDFYHSVAGVNISRDLHSLKSVYAYTHENLGYHRKVDKLDSSFQALKIRYITGKPFADTGSILKQIEKLFRKRENETVALRVEVQNLRKQNYLLKMDTVRLCEKFRNMMKDEYSWKHENKALQQKLQLYERGAYWGLSLGFNYFFNNPPEYFIKADSTIGTLNNPKGVSFLVSAIVGYKFHEKHSFIFNVPLGDFTNNSQTAIGIFNQKLAGGLGYGYHIYGVSIIGIVNISPYQKIAPELLNGPKIAGDVYSKVNLAAYPTSTAYSPSFTLGMSYNFLRKPVLNTAQPD